MKQRLLVRRTEFRRLLLTRYPPSPLFLYVLQIKDLRRFAAYVLQIKGLGESRQSIVDSQQLRVGYGCGNPNISHDWLATQSGYSSVI
jgi:hypothetical protein